MKGFFKSSIGKKLIMSVTGCFLILFLTFHMCMNFVAVISAEGYNKVCEFLGTNWYALVGTAILALGFVFHIVYASVLTIQNRIRVPHRLCHNLDDSKPQGSWQRPLRQSEPARRCRMVVQKHVHPRSNRASWTRTSLLPVLG